MHMLVCFKRDVTSLCVFQTPMGGNIWDVSAGDQHTLLLADGTTFCPEIYYIGKQPGLELQHWSFDLPPGEALEPKLIGFKNPKK